MNLDEQLADAKLRLDRAARACMQNRPGAAQAADRAMREVLDLQALQRAAKGDLLHDEGMK